MFAPAVIRDDVGARSPDVRIAIVGGGIAGITAAVDLAPACSVTLFEAGPTLGGHAHTVPVDLDGEQHALDIGFMVFNDRTYPTFTRLLDGWGVAWQPSTMSFGVSCADTGLEYAGTGPSGLFAQRRTLASPTHWRMLADIVRFGRMGRGLLASGDRTTPIGAVLADGRWSRGFVDHYLMPLGSAVWSCAPDDFAAFPAGALCAFLDNHGMLTFADRPRWRTVRGGSARYTEAAARQLGPAVRTGAAVRAVRRDDESVIVRTDRGEERFDQVVMALHADDALDVLVDATPTEKEVLGAFPYAANDVVLHTDRRMLPRARRAWASWNYHRPRVTTGAVQVTYHLNRLQSVRSAHDFCVTLNRADEIDPRRILWQRVLRHPVYSSAAFAAQDRHAEISGVARIHFCGAYWGWGFHEDGAASGARAAAAILAGP
jgi:predicted NAD/FAD-binding protein